MNKPTYEELELKLAEAQAYADKLAAGLPDGMLPKDVENLREANLALANELENWKIAANNGCGCDTPEGLAAFIINCSDC